MTTPWRSLLSRRAGVAVPTSLESSSYFSTKSRIRPHAALPPDARIRWNALLRLAEAGGSALRAAGARGSDPAVFGRGGGDAGGRTHRCGRPRARAGRAFRSRAPVGRQPDNGSAQLP